jgi:peroxiredoxin
MQLVLFGMVLPWLLVAFGAWLLMHLLRQNGRIVLRLEAIEQRLNRPNAPPPRPAGLAAGTPAPEFELPDVHGVRQSLSQFRGKRVLLVFFNRDCDYCLELAPDLAAVPVDGAEGHPIPVIVANGPAERDRDAAAEFGFRGPVLIQTRGEVAARYQAEGTPMGYLIDENGVLASDRAVGADAILALVSRRRTERPSSEGRPAGSDGTGACPGAPEAAQPAPAASAQGAPAGPGSNGQGGASSPRAPSLARQAWSFAQAMADFVADGCKTLSEAEYRRRIEVCDGCDQRRGNRCLVCGCYLRLKARGRAFRCPLDKWPEEQPEPVEAGH